MGTAASWAYQPTRAHLTRFANQARALGARLGKTEMDIEVVHNGLRLRRERWAPFWTELAHVIRNAVDHGIEHPEERESAGKKRTARLELTTSREGPNIVVTLSDDGRGINWCRVAECAKARGLPAETASELVEALFAPGLSTRHDVTEVSGRGVGLSAVKVATEELGGAVEVQSELGQGTTFRFVVPADRDLVLGARGRNALPPTIPPQIRSSPPPA